MANTTLGSAMFNQGTYYITNRMLSPSGKKLALTFNRENNTVTVTPLFNATDRAVRSPSASIIALTDVLNRLAGVQPTLADWNGLRRYQGTFSWGFVRTLRNTPSGATYVRSMSKLPFLLTF
ncbi:hypothetical protein BDN71DRAFT_1444146 [Pleurotus eryngii]|uniref:CCL2-like lectin domain-containing protein n=1 Tax=Pleurotus eryngii TaxID=5323 RepID=A0A9P6A0N9_PLEER|nr:hypothetical protein BDN71DRAFT_1444146 [Pleurotus eryngii]